MSRALVAIAVVPLFACAGARVERAESDRAEASAPLSGAAQRRTLVARILAENVRLLIYEGKEARRTASGVVIATETTAQGSSTYVLTNAHVVDVAGMKDPRLTALAELPGVDAMEYEAEPVAVGRVPEMDLALIRLWGARLPVARLADDADVLPGDAVVVAGAPFGRPLSVSGGMVSQVELDPKTHQARMLKTDAAIGYGASGGGVYSLETGRLLAIVEGYRTAKVGFDVAQQTYSFDVPMPGETFAAPVAKVRAFLDRNGYGRFLTANGPSSDPVGARAASR